MPNLDSQSDKHAQVILSEADQKTKPIRVIHTSDIHLGEDGTGDNGGPRNRAERALKALVDLTIQLRASLLIIAGDLFDHNRVDASIVEFAQRELLRSRVPVVILPGNHDCLALDSVYRLPYFSKSLPNIHIFTAPEGERISFADLDLAVWGKPIISYDGDLRPMIGVPPRGIERWQIAVAHGHYVGALTDEPHSFQISEEEIVRSSQDYVALGHLGAFRCVCNEPVKAYFTGSPSITGAVAVVDFDTEVGVEVCRQPLAL